MSWGKTVHRGELNTKKCSLYVAQYSISYVHFLITSHAGVTSFTWQIVSLIRTWNVTYLFEWVFIKVRDVNRNWIKPLMRNHVCLCRGVAIVHHASQPCLHLQFLLPLQAINLQQEVQWSWAKYSRESVGLCRVAEWLIIGCRIIPLKATLLFLSFGPWIRLLCRAFLIFKYSTWDDTLHILWGGWLN